VHHKGKSKRFGWFWVTLAKERWRQNRPGGSGPLKQRPGLRKNGAGRKAKFPEFIRKIIFVICPQLMLFNSFSRYGRYPAREGAIHR
jgi:hypothetical protein